MIGQIIVEEKSKQNLAAYFERIYVHILKQPCYVLTIKKIENTIRKVQSGGWHYNFLGSGGCSAATF